MQTLIEPQDSHNETLIDNVHPSDWTNPTTDGTYNLVAIGAGTAGLVSAAGAAGLGAKVALIERHLMGGDCLNVGCVPSKGLLGPAHLIGRAREGRDMGLQLKDGYDVDFPGLMERMRAIRAKISHHDSAKRFSDLGVDVFIGEARFTGPNTIEVGDRTLHFKKAVIATGARASAPPIPGLDQIDYLTNETIFSLTERSKRLGIIGAGPIGCEMAQSFANFGTEVTLIEAMHGVLPNEDPEASEYVKYALIKDGVNVLCCGKNVEIEKREDGIHLVLDSHEQAYDVAVDQLLVAVGRAPNIDALNLEAAGVEAHKKGIEVDDHLRTSNRNIFAAGDVASKYQFTHAADFMARIVIQNALFKGRAKASALTIPWCTYTAPELAHVGLTPKTAKDEGVEIDTYTQPFDAVDRNMLEGETAGFVRVHTRKGTDELVGATIVGAHAGDMLPEIVLAMTHGLGLKKIASTIHPYPTRAEAIRRIGDQYSRTRLTPFVKKLMGKWLAWQRR